MFIKHEREDAEVVGFGGTQYETLGDGVFEVPDEVGAELCGFAHWTQYFGETPSGEPSEPERETAETEGKPKSRNRRAPKSEPERETAE